MSFTARATRRVLALVTALVLATVGLVSLTQPARAATTKTVSVTASGFDHARFPNPVKSDGTRGTPNGVYVAAFDQNTDLSEVTMENMGETVAGNAAWVTKAKVGAGNFKTSLSGVPTGKSYKVVTWVAHGNITSKTILTTTTLPPSATKISIKWDVHNAVKGKLSLAKPTISGSAKAGKTLAAKVSKKTSGSKLTYQWYKASGKKWAKVGSGTKSTYKVPSALKGRKVLVKVTAKKSGYTTLARNSAAKKIAK
jgi:hypothetical protein